MMLQPLQAQMLAPAAVLVCWSLVMLAWLARARFAAMARAGFDLKQARPGGRGRDLEGKLPDAVMWKSHNYTHLMEQPTLFYAAVVILALAGPTPSDLALAWGYAGLRIVHSLYQSTINRVPVRFTIFALATACLIGLAVRSAIVTLGAY